MTAPTTAGATLRAAAAGQLRPFEDAHRALIPGWLTFFLLGMAATSASEVLPGAP